MSAFNVVISTIVFMQFLAICFLYGMLKFTLKTLARLHARYEVENNLDSCVDNQDGIG